MLEKFVSDDSSFFCSPLIQPHKPQYLPPKLSYDYFQWVFVYRLI